MDSRRCSLVALASIIVVLVLFSLACGASATTTPRPATLSPTRTPTLAPAATSPLGPRSTPRPAPASTPTPTPRPTATFTPTPTPPNTLAPEPTPDKETQGITESFNGRQILFTWRKGGPIYGWYYSKFTRFCLGGEYSSVTRSERETVLGNKRVRNSLDRGVWNVYRTENGVVLDLKSEMAGDTLQPLILADGRVMDPSGRVSIVQGKVPIDC